MNSFVLHPLRPCSAPRKIFFEPHLEHSPFFISLSSVFQAVRQRLSAPLDSMVIFRQLPESSIFCAKPKEKILVTEFEIAFRDGPDKRTSS